MGILDDLDTGDDLESQEVAEGAEAEKEVEAAPGKPEGGKPETIPLAAHTEERNKLMQRIRALEAEKGQLSEQNSKFKALEDQIRSLREERAAIPEKPIEKPDYLEDPKGYTDAAVAEVQKAAATLAEKLEASEKSAKQTQQLTQEQLQMNAALRALERKEAEFAARQADYGAALDHVRTVRTQQLKLMHPDATDEQIGGQIALEEFRAGIAAMQSNRNPSELVYQYAKTVGYVPPKEDKNLTEEQKAEIAARRDKAEGLGGAGGGGDDENLDALLNAEEDEFELAMKEAFG